MAKKNIITVCGAGVATSSIVMLKIQELAADHGLDISITKCQASEFESKLKTQHLDLVVSTTRLPDLGVPVMDGKPFLTGIGVEGITQKMVQILSG
jgi:galactitol PTS system EIIB component